MNAIKKSDNRNVTRAKSDNTYSGLLDDFFNGFFGAGLELKDWNPHADFIEKKNEYQIKADLPGINEDDLDVSLQNNILTIKGQREYEEKEENDSYSYVERSSGSFCRSFRVPEDVDTEKLSADYKKGVLSIKLPKSEKKAPKKLNVKVK